MQVIVRKERPHPGAQLRFTDVDGHRLPASSPTRNAASPPTSSFGTAGAPGARTASGTPRILACGTCLKGFAQNQLWCEIVALACEPIAWTQMLALTGKARLWKPKRLRFRIFAVAGRLGSGGRRLRLRIAGR